MGRSEEALVEEYRRMHARAFDRTRRTGRPAYLRRELRYGWRSRLPLYVLWCQDCRMFSVAHPAGYGRIHCRVCRRHEKVMTWQRFRDKPFGTAFAYAAAIIMLLLAAAFATSH
ncbi:MAG: hypothetical protein RL272_1308 [Candidatus Parcubacteria bacterium]